MHSKLRYSLAAGLLAAALTPLSAQSVTTTPVGAMSITVKAQSDSLLAVPFTKSAVSLFVVDAVSSNTITASGSPGWSTNQFVYTQGVQPSTYYAVAKSGAKRGAYFTITANTGNGVTLDLNGDTLALVSQGDTFEIIPYVTLADVFGVFPGVGTFTPQVELQTYDLNAAGVNLAVQNRFFYYSGTSAGGAGWRRAGSSPTTKFDNTILPPGVPFRIRNTTLSDVSLTTVGVVPVSGHFVEVGTLSSNTPQDNIVGLVSAANVTLADSGLVASGAMSPSSTFTPTDTLLVIDNAQQGYDKSASAIYFYYSGAAAGGAGWRRSGASPTSKFDDVMLDSSSGYIIRKASSATPSSTPWVFVPSYISDL